MVVLYSQSLMVTVFAREHAVRRRKLLTFRKNSADESCVVVRERLAAVRFWDLAAVGGALLGCRDAALPCHAAPTSTARHRQAR